MAGEGSEAIQTAWDTASQVWSSKEQEKEEQKQDDVGCCTL